MSRIILKLSGESLKGNKESGIDYDVVLKYAKEIKKVYDLCEYGIGIIIGGGNFFRGRDALKAGLERVDCDYMGMMGTILNSVAMKDILESIGVKVELYTSLSVPDAFKTYNKDEAIKALDDKKVVLFAGGTGKPYCSTDSATLLKAKDVMAKTVLMGKNGVDGVYDSDPKINPQAKKYDILSHKEILDKKLNVMDLEAAQVAMDENIDIIVFNVDKENAIIDALSGKNIGTLIKKEI